MPTPFDVAIAQARSAQGEWAAKSLRERLKPVRLLRQLIAEYGQRLGLATTQDVGRPADEVLATDVLPTADALRWLEGHAAGVLRSRTMPSALRPWWLWGERETIHRRAHGVVGVIGTWNYPILLNAVPIAQALVAGNAVAWKPSELTSTVGKLTHDLFLEAGFPADLFALLPTDRDSGPQLIEADIDFLVFTGSAEVGRQIARRLGERLIPSILELSGCDAMFVLDDADPALAAKAAWFGSMLNKGQTCLAVRRAFVHRSRYEEFVSALKPLAADARPDPLELMGQATQAERLVKDATEQGARLLTAAPPTATDEPPRFPPSVVVDATPAMAICCEASFAPLLAVVPFDDESALPAMSEQCPFGLGASVFTASTARAEALAARLRVGSVSVNDAIVGTAHPAVAFGGLRQSGWGVTRGDEGLFAMTVPQAVTTRGGKFRPHYAGSSPAMADMIRALLQWGHARRLGDRGRGMLKSMWAGWKVWRE